MSKQSGVLSLISLILIMLALYFYTQSQYGKITQECNIRWELDLAEQRLKNEMETRNYSNNLSEPVYLNNVVTSMFTEPQTQSSTENCWQLCTDTMEPQQELPTRFFAEKPSIGFFEEAGLSKYEQSQEAQ